MRATASPRPRLGGPKGSFEETIAKARRLATENLKGTVIIRSLEAILRCVEAADTQDLREIAHAPTNYEVLLRQLNGCLDVLRGDDPLIEARVRGLKMKEELLKKAGGALDADGVAQLLHLTRQAVHKRRKARKLLAIQFGKRGFLYPAFQFEEALADSVVRVLGQLDPRIRDWNLLTFFLNGNSYLDGASPIEALRQAAVDEVLRAAQAYGSQGAG